MNAKFRKTIIALLVLVTSLCMSFAMACSCIGTPEEPKKEVVKESEPKKEAPKAEPKGKKKPAKKQTAEELQAEIERKTAELQKCLADLERKKKLSSDRSAFMSALDDLDAAEAKLGEEDGFNSPNYKLKFSGGYATIVKVDI